MEISNGTRWAARAQFFCSGFVFATWGVHIPTVKSHYGVDEAELGLAMLAAGLARQAFTVSLRTLALPSVRPRATDRRVWCCKVWVSDCSSAALR